MKHLLYMFFFIIIFFFFTHFLSVAEANQESTTLNEALNLDLAVSVSDNKTITEISSSITNSETWLKSHVLSLYPSTKITTIVVVSSSRKPNLVLVLSCLKNLHHSLIRWGLEKEIKVSLGFQNSENTKNLEMFEPVLVFLKSINSTFTIINPPSLNHLEKFESLRFNRVNILNLKPQEEASKMNRRRDLDISSKITIHFPTLPSPSSPETSSIGSPTNPNPPISSPIGPISSPTNPNPPISQPRNPNPPISQPRNPNSPFSQPPTNPNSPISQPTNPNPPISQPRNPNSPISQPRNPNSPNSQPINPNSPISQPRNPNSPIPQPPINPISQPINPNPKISQPPTNPNSPISSPGLYLPPPCLPSPAPSPTQAKKKKDVEGLWCVAKPTVAAETLQQALDFACGEGGADCDEIRSPHGICFYPDTVMAHASYALNSYWQKNKRNGGTCSFGGTAMLITTDPSYQHCRFILS